MTCTVSGASSSSQTTKTITDMAGRTVTIPNNITSVLGTAPTVTVMTYIIAPDDLVGLNSNYNQSKYLPGKYKNLPNVGMNMGQTKLNPETYQSMHPDVVLYDYTPGYNSLNAIDELQSKLDPIPVVAVTNITDANHFDSGMTFMGDLLNNPEKSDEFNKFYKEIYTKVNQTVASIPEKERKKVYYAVGSDGLTTAQAGTMHAQPINICGGINVADFPLESIAGRTAVSFEQVLKWNPDVIVVADKPFYDKVYSDPNWKTIKAVQDKQVYLIPSQPFNWYDRSPGVNTVMGIPWTAKVLYPEQFSDIDLVSLTKEFYSKFYHYDLTDSEAKDIISSSGLSVS